MRLYSFSNETRSFTEVKWVEAKIAVCGMLLAAIVLFGIVRLNQTVTQANDSRSAEILSAENRVLRSQLHLMSPRISALEMQVSHLAESVNTFRMTFNHPANGRDTTWRLTDATRRTSPRSEVSAARVF